MIGALPDENIVGKLVSVTESSDRIQLRIARYSPDGDCNVTQLPMLTRCGEEVNVAFSGGLRVEVVCVSEIRGVNRWNVNVPPLAINI